MTTFLRVALSFATVGGLLWLFARASQGRLGALLGRQVGGDATRPLTVLERCQLTKGTSVALVRVGRRHVLIGVADSGVQLLAEGDDLAAAVDDGDEPDDGVEPDADATDDPTIDLVEWDRPAPDQPALPSARTRRRWAERPDPPRTSVIDALRERTVRRS